MNYRPTDFEYNSKTKILSQDLSLLKHKGRIYGTLPSGVFGITLTNASTSEDMSEMPEIMEFAFVGHARDKSGKDIYGWHFRPTMATVAAYPQTAGSQVLIIND